MIPRLWCWLWGHKRKYDDWTGMEGTGYHTVRSYIICPRCGTRLKEVEK